MLGFLIPSVNIIWYVLKIVRNCGRSGRGRGHRMGTIHRDGVGDGSCGVSVWFIGVSRQLSSASGANLQGWWFRGERGIFHSVCVGGDVRFGLLGWCHVTVHEHSVSTNHCSGANISNQHSITGFAVFCHHKIANARSRPIYRVRNQCCTRTGHWTNNTEESKFLLGINVMNRAQVQRRKRLSLCFLFSWFVLSPHGRTRSAQRN